VTASLVAAVAALALLTLLPGPDLAVVTRLALSSGRGQAVRGALGIVTGLLVWGLLTVAGLAALLAASPVAYAVVTWAGAGYLVLLGLRALWQSRSVPASPGEVPVRSAGSGYRTGLVTNLLNPKIAVFYTGLLPGLVPDGAP
jgi:threonine/homoserine/homoserine lactone efflux protein